MSQRYAKTPAEIIGIENDEYTSFCFNEACALIMGRLDNKEEIHFRVEYKSFSDLYKKYENQ